MSESRPNKKPSSKRTRITETTEARARQLRRTMSPPEAKLWSRLRNRQLLGLRFRRQQPLAPFVLDFYCDEAKLAVELDGRHHAAQPNRDRARDSLLLSRGIETLRITVSSFERDIGHALNRIAQAARTRLATLSPRVVEDEEQVEDEAPSAAAKPAAAPPTGEDAQRPRSH
jgi:very-short-patch-repair endonuclease